MGRARAGLAAGLVALVVAAPSEGKLTGTPSVQTVVRLEPNGVLDVLERVSVRAGEPTATTWQVTMQRGELFAQPSLIMDDRRYRAGDGKHTGTFLISRGQHGIRFDWLQPGGAHALRLAYRLALVGTAYTDVVDLRVPVWERDWPVTVRELTASLRLPKSPRGRVILWIEQGSLAGTVARTGDRIRLRTRNVGAGDPVTLHTVLPRNVLTTFEGVTVKTKPGLAAILAERRGTDSPWWPWALAAAGALAVSAVALRTARSRLPRRH